MFERKDVINHEDFFMTLAILASKRSKDPNTQVGAIAVNEDKRVISLGYNGLPRGCKDFNYNWSRGTLTDNKYLYSIHAEQNLIFNSIKPLKDSTVYVNVEPCIECSKYLIQVGVKKIVYLNKYENLEDYKRDAIKRMCDDADVELVQYTGTIQDINIIRK